MNKFTKRRIVERVAYLERSSSSFSAGAAWASAACSGATSAPSSVGFDFRRPGIDGMWGIETWGIETVGIDTDGKLDGSQPETFPVTLENIPPDAFVGLQGTSKVWMKITRTAQTARCTFIFNQCLSKSAPFQLPPAGGLLIYWGRKARAKNINEFHSPALSGASAFTQLLFEEKSETINTDPRKDSIRLSEKDERLCNMVIYGWASPCSFYVVVFCWWLDDRLLYGLFGWSCSCCWLRWSWDFFVSVLREHRRERWDLICNSREHDWFAFGCLHWLLTIHLRRTELLRSAKLFHQNHANENFPLFHVFRLLISLGLHFALAFHCLFH